MNSDNVRKEVGPSGSHEFLYMVEGRSTESCPHADNVVQERSCVRVTRLLCSVGNSVCLPAHGRADASVLPFLTSYTNFDLIALCSLQMLVIVLRQPGLRMRIV